MIVCRRLYTKRTVPFVYYISVHLKNIYESGELKKEGTIEEFSVVRLSNCRLLQQKNDSQIISLEVVANCDNFGDVRALLEIPSITIGGKYLMGYLEFCGCFTPILDGIANLIYNFGSFLMFHHAVSAIHANTQRQSDPCHGLVHNPRCQSPAVMQGNRSLRKPLFFSSFKQFCILKLTAKSIVGSQ